MKLFPPPPPLKIDGFECDTYLSIRFDISREHKDKNSLFYCSCFRESGSLCRSYIWHTAWSETCFCYPVDNRGVLVIGNSRDMFDLFASAVYHLA